MSGSVAKLAVAAALLYLSAMLLTACPGVKYAKHDGYRNKRKTPWKRPKRLKMDADGEAEIDGDVNYAKRKRARWYAITLPGDGDLSVKLEITPGSQYEDFDLGFEVYSPKHKVLHRSDAEAEDVGELKKSAELASLPKGTYLIHIFAQARQDTAEFELRVKFGKGSAKHTSNFPASVDFPSPLASIPLFEAFSCGRCSCKNSQCKQSCNKCSFCRNCSCRSRKCRNRCPQKCRRTNVRPPKFSCRTCSCKHSSRCRKTCTKKCTKKPTQPSGVIYGTITRSRRTSGGTKIRVNRGRNVGVKVGWRGLLLTKTGVLANGSFKVTQVKGRYCYGIVPTSLDAVGKATRVRLSP